MKEPDARISLCKPEISENGDHFGIQNDALYKLNYSKVQSSQNYTISGP